MEWYHARLLTASSRFDPGPWSKPTDRARGSIRYMRNVIAACIIAVTMSACIPKPTNAECHEHADCLSCVESFCAWCGPRPGVRGTGPATTRSCYAAEAKPEACDPPPHYVFCTQGVTTPIDNRMFRRAPDGGADATR